MIDEPSSVVLLAAIGDYLGGLSRMPVGCPLEPATRYELRVAANLMRLMEREASATDLESGVSAHLADALAALGEVVDDTAGPNASVRELAQRLDRRLAALAVQSAELRSGQETVLATEQQQVIHHHLTEAVVRRLDIQRPEYRLTAPKSDVSEP